VDPLRGEVRRRITIGGYSAFSTNVASGSGAVWVVTEAALFRVHPATDEPTLLERTVEPPASVHADVAIGEGHVWVGTADGRLLRLEPRTGERTWRSGLDPIESVTVGHGAVWTIDALSSSVTRLDPGSMTELDMSPPISGGVDALVSGQRYVWVLSRNVGSLTQVNATTNTAEQTIQVGEAPTSLAVGLGSVWVGDEDGVIRRVDEDTLQVTEIPIGAEIRGVAVDEETETLWVDVA
jgi:streptogramin lyase